MVFPVLFFHLIFGLDYKYLYPFLSRSEAIAKRRLGNSKRNRCARATHDSAFISNSRRIFVQQANANDGSGCLVNGNKVVDVHPDPLAWPGQRLLLEESDGSPEAITMK